MDELPSLGVCPGTGEGAVDAAAGDDGVGVK